MLATYDDYTAAGFATATADNFEQLKNAAVHMLAKYIGGIKRLNTIAAGDDDYTVTLNEALLYQIDFMATAGITNSVDMQQNNFKSVSIGRLNLQLQSDLTSLAKKDGTAYSALNALGQVGLLYRGGAAL